MVAEVVINPPPSEVPAAAKETTEDTANANNVPDTQTEGKDTAPESSCDSAKRNTSVGSMSGQMHEVELEEEVSFDISPSESKRGVEDTEQEENESSVVEQQRELNNNFKFTNEMLW